MLRRRDMPLLFDDVTCQLILWRHQKYSRCAYFFEVRELVSLTLKFKNSFFLQHKISRGTA
jgi:hypothetical protein